LLRSVALKNQRREMPLLVLAAGAADEAGTEIAVMFRQLAGDGLQEFAAILRASGLA
jgi:hypothetical protein